MELDHTSRGHALLSASSSKQWINCPPSARLQEQFANESSVFAKEGTYCHEVTEHKIRTRYFCENVQAPDPTEFGSEDAEQATDACYEYVVNVIEEFKASGIEPIVRLEEKIDYTNIAPSGFGTGDFLACGKLPDGRYCLHIIDFKYGRGVPVEADHNTQMMLYAIGALNKFGYIYDFDIIRMTILQPRLDNFSTFEMNQQDLIDWGDSIKPIARMAWEGKGEQKPGDWCRFCRAKAVCNARKEEALRLAREEFSDEEGQPTMKAPLTVGVDEIARLLPTLNRISEWIESAIAFVSNAAINEGVHVPGYKVVRGRSVRTLTDKEKVAEILQENGYTEIWKPMELLPMTDLEKLCGKKEFAHLLKDYIVKPLGKPVMVPESDKRQAIETPVDAQPATTAEDDFEDLD